jgi:predicted alpha/beta hydrolase family esterase
MANIGLPDAIFIHCSGTQFGNQGSTPLFNCLDFELKSELNIRSPLMPNPQAPSYEAWRHAINMLDISQVSIMMGHSLGASVLLKYLAVEKPFLALDALLLIATPLWGLPDWTHGDYFLPADCTKALANIKKIIFYHSTDDDVVPFHHSEMYRKRLPVATLRMLHGQGHYFTKGIPVLVDDLKYLKTSESNSPH